MTNERPSIVVCGPTASGKSSLAMRLARAVSGEVVGADSVQVYKRLDIGSAKPSLADRASVPHHLVDLIPLDEEYDAGRFARESAQVVSDIQSRGKTAIVCGGAGMYLRAFLYGMIPSPPIDESLRRGLKERAQNEGSDVLHAELAKVDALAAERIHPNDVVRIVRALEVYTLTGKGISAFHSRHDMETPRLETFQIALSPTREVLYQGIDERVDRMMAMGWTEEVTQILADGYDPGLKPLGSLGYRQLVAFLTSDWQDRGEAWAETLRLIKRDHRRYAKRQLTWFKGQPHIHWFNNSEDAFAAAMSALER